MKLEPHEKKSLLDIAWTSIIRGLESSHPYIPIISDLPQIFHQKAASFVTVYLHEQLKGCVGSIRPVYPLALDVSKNAFLAAFQDNRFDPVQRQDLPSLKIEISILSTPVKLNIIDESDLLEHISRHKCGLILKYKNYQSTYLPTVWEKLKDSVEFLCSLKKKAGLEPDFWSRDIEVFAYNAEKIS